MWKYIVVFSLLGLLGLSCAQIVQIGQCDPNIQLVTNFNATRFTGKWYGIARTDNAVQDADCSTLELTATDTGFTVLNEAVNRNFYEQITGTATHEAGTAKFTLTVSVSDSPVDFWILNTDYDNFAMAYACKNLSATERSVYLWQLGRMTEYVTDLMPVLMNTTIYSQFGITLRDLRSIEHSDKACHVLPEIPLGESIILPGQCDPNITALQNFEAARFTGVWHIIANYFSADQQGACGRAQYTLNGSVVEILNSEVINQTLRTISGTATVASTDNSAKLAVSLEVAPNVFSSAELWVLGSDYDNFAVSYGCRNLADNQRRVSSWILGRTRVLSESTRQAVNEVIDAHLDLNERYFAPADQSDESCFYFPEPAPDRPVVFRGQCNQSIPALSNFNVSRYLGLWHTIEAYPSVWEDGTCVNARYTLGDGVVDVLNTQVVNQSLVSINGFAQVASTDGTAKLDVTFNVGGVNQTISYWVLDTDYDSYSFVYTCQNINADDMQVWSWKLSRTKALTAAANTAINRIIDTVQVLDARYYVARNQSDEACFFFPEPQPGVPVVFPGRCDTTIPVVDNFNMQSFTGTWHEYQAYPKQWQRGQCTSHSYTSGTGNTLNVISSTIVDQFLETSNGTLSFSSADTSGRLTITVGGETLPFWILAVDYSDYAFAYSCVDLPEDFRRIFSWKLTRSQGTLSTAANTAINNIIATNVVLDDRYYQDVDQSAEACYSLPDLPYGVPIIVPGQCDPNITVVQNFNAERYTGLWRLIESYYTEFQNGDCHDATYTLNDTTVVVYNTQVINQSLVTITGSAVLASNDSSARLLVSFPGMPGQSDYWVLDTDYDSYALVYSCVNVNNQERRVYSWKLSRTDQLTQTAETNINRIVNSVQVLNNRFFEKVDRSDAACFYFPEPDPSTPVIFRGQCDESIPVVTNFNAVRNALTTALPIFGIQSSFDTCNVTSITCEYMELWHDIESYPSVFQGGTCNNNFLSILGNGQFSVVNTQVIDQSLRTATAVARPATNDTSAKLIVSFPVAGTNLTRDADYWVLGTDYDTYAFVYSCANLPDNHRQVNSWKLSRTKQLTANAITQIDSIIATVPVLQQQYFIARNQTPEGCFFFPEPQPGVPVEFPGQCDNSIQAVPNFNLTLFSGIWHEIEAYPKEQATGQCINHDYTQGTANNFTLVSSSVLDLSLLLSTSTATLTSTDGSGRLTITISEGNNVVTIPFWILATNYADYALAYSCVNTRTDFRAVYSWKLSRTKTLSTEANTAFNNSMQNIDVIDNRYFEPINQTDEACFFLPERVPGSSAPIVFPGQCDTTIPVVQNFNATRYGGRWRLIESYPTPFQRGTCQEATYTLNGTQVLVHNTEVVNQTLDTLDGFAVLASTDGSGKLLVTFPTSPEPAQYWILDTDYDSYALVYSCQNINSEQRVVLSWKLSRTRNLSQTAITNINRVVDSINVLNERYFDIADQSDAGCFYFPEPDPTRPVIFRGCCDQNISVVSNFDPVRYMGLWRDVESYPTGFQAGTCGNAQYTLNGTVVDVLNTEVINQSLSTINGIAILASIDGSGKLNVTFPIAGTNNNITTNYWILDTDYASYALVYTCVDLEDELRQVWSWKLSRQRQLTNAAQTAINAVVQTIPVLDSRYYIQRNQTPEACFFFPEPQPGVPVEFPGECDNNIQAISNFSLQQFIGLWHEIEAYPKDQQTGQCVNHEYSIGTGNTLNLVSTSVYNLTLNTTTGSVAITSTDGSGRLSIVIITNGTTVTIPFWVLDTDYTNYALAYSCVNTRPDFRTVYSWKLSRTKQLRAVDNTAINNVINTIDVLDNKYYETINQSDEACFYLPALGPNDPVVFRGQCDPNIPVVQNFNLTRYANRWRLIETYQADWQSGTCIGSNYNLIDSNTLSANNNQVINQTLRTVEGTIRSTDGSGKLVFGRLSDSELADYWVLDTDYDSYAFVYKCQNLNSDQRRVWSWKLSRNRTLSTTAVANINRVINSVDVLNQRFYQDVSHTDDDCFYYPEPDGNAVVFRGQCDENIPVVANFDAERYMGTWYDIESYPQAFQSGTCSSATYTLTENGVDVYNTQVINQQLDTIRGVAVPLNGTDAKLIVTFPIAGTDMVISTPYWVLTTDYASYALVYSCTNLDEDSRRVTSWKLSRTRNLTANAITQFQQVMATVPVLREQYFSVRGHSNEDCFFYPDNNGGPVILDGECLDQDVVTDFNLTRFAGTWHEVSRFPSNLQTGDCANSEFTVTGSNSSYLTQGIVYNERRATISGNVTMTDGNRGILQAILTRPGYTIAIDLYVLSTDYDDHALVFQCLQLPNNRKQILSWKYARSRDGFSAASNTTINNIVSSNIDLFEGYYETTDQSNDGCFYYPEFAEPPTNITLIGPCDERIRGKPNFDAGAYLGRWYEIASYPQLFQFGECSRAEYIADDGAVRVVNTQVYNQTLDIMIGSAVVASNDGSGVLNVTFAFGDGIVNVANYYILETDYTDFALVYSCRNVENNTRRQVTSWKLSRTRSLSSNASAVIDRIINSTQGLLQDYYTPTRQDEEACFYIPELNRDQAPRFRGQCPNITGVQNFNAQRYIGWWHEIERYPSDHDVGECISLDFRASGNQFQIVTTNIFNVTAQVNTSTVVVSNDGRLRKTYSDGSIVDLWVLATDYDTYSLLYSCETDDVDPEYVRVWSAKHSKTRSLSEAARDEMAGIIAGNLVLQNDFYLPVNQTDAACFHYPEQTGTRIILPGQCDDNIPVMQGFDAGEYTGTWFQIERYRQPFESGNCTGATYTLNENTGVISVRNWQVVDGVLDIIDGTANVSSTDGSARFIVTLPVRGSEDPVLWTESQLWVLITDYVSYSLVYNCVNINEYFRSIGAWKLSRTRTMPSVGTTAINDYMEGREELHHPYFIQVGQSDDCLEPSSGIIVRSSIILMLVCALLQFF